MPDDLISRARELGAPMHAPEPAIARRSELLLALADRVEALADDNRRLRAACEAVEYVRVELERRGGGSSWCSRALAAALELDPSKGMAPAAAGGEGT